MQFYIKYGNSQDGPFDLVTMIRKIRNKEIARDALVLEENDRMAVAAAEHPKLQSFYEELQTTYVEEGLEPYLAPDGFSYGLRRGWQFLQHYQNSMLYSAAFIFIILLAGAVLSSVLPDVLGIFFGWVLFHFLNGGMLLAVKQLGIHHRVDIGFITAKYLQHFKSMLLYSVTLAFLSLLGGVLLVIPGLLVITLFLFAPLLILQEDYSFRQAMEASKHAAQQHGRRMFELLFGLTVINFVAATFLLLPLAITLPLTYAVAVDIFDRMSFQR